MNQVIILATFLIMMRRYSINATDVADFVFVLTIKSWFSQ